MTVIAVATIGMLALLTLVIGLLFAFTPYLMRRTECFAVTVPASAQRDPRLVLLKRRYAVVMLVLTAAATISSLAAGMLMVSGQEGIGTALMCAALLVPVVMSFVLMLRNRRRVSALKRSEGWGVRSRQAVASVAEEGLPGAIPLTWDLIYVPVILGTVCLGLVLYPGMPDLLPMHADFLGNVNRYVPKTPGSAIGFPVAFEAFLAVCFVFSHWMILRSKRPVDPGAPATSVLAYGLFARAQSVLLLATGVLMSAGSGLLFLLSSAGLIGLGQAGLGIIILCAPFAMGGVVLSVVYGQMGSRVFRRMQGGGELLSDDDEHWWLGMFYVNRGDASIFLPKRFGFGWTLNFARPAAWALVVGIPALTVGFVLLVSILTG